MGSMDDPVAEIERRAQSLNLPLDVILKEASVHGTTWRRWKRDSNGPTYRSLKKIHDAIERLKATH